MFDPDDLEAIREGNDSWEAETYGPTVERSPKRSTVGPYVSASQLSRPS